MGGIMFNEDCTHFAYSWSTVDRMVGLADLHRFIDQYAGTQVREFVINVNAMTAWYPSAVRENAVEKYERLLAAGALSDPVSHIARVLRDLFVTQGIDMYGVWIARLRERGISPWISIRMNDIHNATEDDHFLVTQFYRDHKYATRGAHRRHSSYYDSAFDYTRPEVRNHYLELITEIAGRYDFDGLELDWMREPYTLGIGAETWGAAIITDFMREVREILDRAASERGHAVKMSARVPYSPEASLRFGLDALGWARAGLVDALVVTPRWQTIDNDMPIDLWKQMLEGTGVMLCAGLEILLSPVRSWQAGIMNSVETARGSAASYLGMGADRVYLFNYFDDEFAQDKSNVAEDSYCHPKNYPVLLNTVGELDTSVPLPRRHIVTFHDVTAPGLKLADPLPVTCAPRRPAEIRIATGPIPERADVTLILGVDIEEPLTAEDFNVYVNSVSCAFIGPCDSPAPKPPAGRMYAFRIENRPGFPQASIIEFESTRARFVVHWVEMTVSVP